MSAYFIGAALASMRQNYPHSAVEREVMSKEQTVRLSFTAEAFRSDPRKRS